MFEQLETTNYPDGNASDFIDVISTHSNIFDTSGPLTASAQVAACGCSLAHCGVLDVMWGRNPRNVGKPIWITEFGWLVSEVGPGTQLEYICKLLRMLTGAYRANEVCVDDWNIRRAFIYKLRDFPGQSDGIYDASGNPRLVVTRYL